MDYLDKEDEYFTNERPEMLKYLPENFRTVLDVGCGEGTFAAQIKEKYKAEIWGVELMQDPGEIAESKLDRVFIGPCEHHVRLFPDDYFDVIYCNDVLEHLEDPISMLRILKVKLSENGILISSIPNIRYHAAFKKIILEKDWEYEDHGIFDRTHLRFFTSKSIARMYNKLGFRIVSHEGINKTRSLKPYLYNIPLLFTAMDMFYLQFATVLRK